MGVSTVRDITADMRDDVKGRTTWASQVVRGATVARFAVVHPYEINVKISTMNYRIPPVETCEHIPPENLVESIKCWRLWGGRVSNRLSTEPTPYLYHIGWTSHSDAGEGTVH